MQRIGRIEMFGVDKLNHIVLRICGNFHFGKEEEKRIDVGGDTNVQILIRRGGREFSGSA